MSTGCRRWEKKADWRSWPFSKRNVWNRCLSGTVNVSCASNGLIFALRGRFASSWSREKEKICYWTAEKRVYWAWGLFSWIQARDYDSDLWKDDWASCLIFIQQIPFSMLCYDCLSDRLFESSLSSRIFSSADSFCRGRYRYSEFLYFWNSTKVNWCTESWCEWIIQPCSSYWQYS